MDYGLEKRIRDTFRWKESWDNLGIEIIKRNFQSSFTFLSMVRNLFSFINLNQFRNQAITFYSR